MLSTNIVASENAAFVWTKLAVSISSLTWNFQMKHQCIPGWWINLRCCFEKTFPLHPFICALEKTPVLLASCNGGWKQTPEHGVQNFLSENTCCGNARLPVSHALDGDPRDVPHPSTTSKLFSSSIRQFVSIKFLTLVHRSLYPQQVAMGERASSDTANILIVIQFSLPTALITIPHPLFPSSFFASVPTTSTCFPCF